METRLGQQQTWWKESRGFMNTDYKGQFVDLMKIQEVNEENITKKYK